MKEEPASQYTEDMKWVSTDFSPFTDVYDPAIEDTEPFAIDENGTMAEHSIEKSYRQLGGFQLQLAIDQDVSKFIDQVLFLKDKSQFVSSKTISASAEVLFFNKSTNQFVFFSLLA